MLHINEKHAVQHCWNWNRYERIEILIHVLHCRSITQIEKKFESQRNNYRSRTWSNYVAIQLARPRCEKKGDPSTRNFRRAPLSAQLEENLSTALLAKAGTLMKFRREREPSALAAIGAISPEIDFRDREILPVANRSKRQSQVTGHVSWNLIKARAN